MGIQGSQTYTIWMLTNQAWDPRRSHFFSQVLVRRPDSFCPFVTPKKSLRSRHYGHTNSWPSRVSVSENRDPRGIRFQVFPGVSGQLETPRNELRVPVFLKAPPKWSYLVLGFKDPIRPSNHWSLLLALIWWDVSNHSKTRPLAFCCQFFIENPLTGWCEPPPSIATLC